MKKNKILFLELNEFSRELLETASKELGLKNIQKMVALHHTETHTDDTYESDFLEPWVQWVSVHTGVPSIKHQIKHLGDVPHLETPQVWEKLSEMGITSGVWGAMNASRNGAKQCLFFVPDPWTASEEAFPAKFNDLLDPLRLISKNYLNRSNEGMGKKIKNLLKLLHSYGLSGPLVRELPALIKNAIRYKGEHFVFISFLDYISTLLFLKVRKQYNTDFSLIFLNSLAHLQHHHWKQDRKRLKIGLKTLDRILGHIFSSLGENETLLVANALSQKNTDEEKAWILYRQLDQANFLQTAGIRFSRVEPHMTHDAHIFFATEEECKRAKKTLENAHICNQKLFLVESYPQDPQKLFYRIQFTDPVSADASMSIGENTFRFLDLFKPIVQRTGKHIPYGTLYSSNNRSPQAIKNHEIFNQIIEQMTAT